MMCLLRRTPSLQGSSSYIVEVRHLRDVHRYTTQKFFTLSAIFEEGFVHLHADWIRIMAEPHYHDPIFFI